MNASHPPALIGPKQELALTILAARAPEAPLALSLGTQCMEDPDIASRVERFGRRAYPYLRMPANVQRLLERERVPFFLLSAHLESAPLYGSKVELYACVLPADLSQLLPIPYGMLATAGGSDIACALSLASDVARAWLDALMRHWKGYGTSHREWLDEFLPLGSGSGTPGSGFEALRREIAQAPEMDPETWDPEEEGGPDVADDAPSWIVCNPAEAENRKEALRSHKTEGRAVLDQLMERSRRTLPRATAAGAAAVRALATDFPNFAPFIGEIARDLALAARLGEPLRLPPTLLLGPPGIGKTHFAGALAEVLDFHLSVRSLAETSAGWIVTGGASSWADSRPGCVARHIAETPDGKAPLLVFDELDKVNTESNYPVDRPLLGLLEPVSARVFRDEYLDIEIDARPVSYIFTANRAGGLRPELLSRMRVVEVQAPSGEQMPAVVRAIDAGLRRGRSRMDALFAPLSDAVVARLSRLPPREVRKALERGYAAAVDRQGDVEGVVAVVPEDLQVEAPACTSRPVCSSHEHLSLLLPMPERVQ